jgi:hypothetical protein
LPSLAVDNDGTRQLFTGALPLSILPDFGIVATIKGCKLDSLFARVSPGTLVDSTDLAALGISADLTAYYVRTGRLQRLARGVYGSPDVAPALQNSILFLQRSLPGLHVSGRSALEWHGSQQTISPLRLSGWQAGHLPEWFTERFPAEYHRNRLFKESANSQLHVQPFDNGQGVPLISTSERALLEMLSEIGVRQPLQEARELVRASHHLRGDVMLDLLKRCLSIKTVRLCLQLGGEFELPWMNALDPDLLPTGSERPWVWRSAKGLLVLKASSDRAARHPPESANVKRPETAEEP